MNVGNAAEHLPLVGDPAGHFQLDTVRLALAGQDGRGGFQVGITLPVLDGAIQRGAQGNVAIGEQPLAAQLDHLGPFGRILAAGKLIEVGRRAEGIAPAGVVMLGCRRLPRQAGTVAVLAEIAAERSVGEILRTHDVAAHTERQLPVRNKLEGILHIGAVGLALVGRRRPRGELARLVERIAGRTQIAQRPADGILVQIFDAGNQLMTHAEQVEGGVQIALQHIVVGIELTGLGLLLRAVGRQCSLASHRPVSALVVGRPQYGAPLGIRRNLEQVVQGRDIRFAVVEVAVHAVVVAGLGHGFVRTLVDERDAVVRAILRLDPQVTERDLMVGAEAEGDARREAHAVDFRLGAGVGIAARTPLIAIHDVEAQRGGISQTLVQVSLDLAETIGTDPDAHLVDAIQHRRLADLVDDAAGLTAAEQHRRGAAQHIDLLQVEDFAVVLRRIADTVEIHVTEGIETAQIHVVASPSAFGCIEGQAGNVAQRFTQRVGFLFLDQRPGHGRDRLRYVVRVLHHLADAGLGGAIAVLLLLIGCHGDRGKGFFSFRQRTIGHTEAGRQDGSTGGKATSSRALGAK